MYRWSLVLLVAAVCQASATFAQADDVAYGKVLGELYLAKVMKADVPTGQVPMPAAQMRRASWDDAMSKG